MAAMDVDDTITTATPEFEVDLGNLSVGWFREEKDFEYLEKGRELVQILVEKLFNLPSTVDKVGRLVNLPKPTLQLPREKPVCVIIIVIIIICAIFVGLGFESYFGA